MSMKSMYQGREGLEHFAQQTFEFLATEHGFVAQPLEHSVWSSTLCYTKDLLAIEVSLDFRDTYVEMEVVKLQNGKIPPHGYVVKGERIRMPCIYLLRDILYVHDTQVDALYDYLTTSQQRGYDFAVTSLQEFRAILVEHLDAIVQQSLDVLFPQTLPPTPSSHSPNI